MIENCLFKLVKDSIDMNIRINALICLGMIFSSKKVYQKF